MSVVLLLLALGCGSGPQSGHSHGPGSHSHGAGAGGHVHAAGPTTAVLSRWTDTHEIFVELDGPVAATRFTYRAHITARLDNHPVDSGSLSMRFEQEGFAVESHHDATVASKGLFAGTAVAPAKAGTYQVIFGYADGGTQVEWAAGEVTVGAEEAVSVPQPGGEVSFLKEAQWQVPFASALAEQRVMSPTLGATGTVRGAPADTTVVAAPVDGLVAWTGGLPVVGRTVSQGERLATLIPAGQSAHWAELQAAVATARAQFELADQDLARVRDMRARDLVPQKRLDQSAAAHTQAKAALTSAEGQISGLSSTSAGAVSIRAPSAGLIVSVGPGHGQPAPAGTPLVTVSGGSSVLIEARVHDRSKALGQVSAMTVSRGDWSGPVDLISAGGQLLTQTLVFEAHTLTAPLLIEAPAKVGLVPGDIVTVEVSSGDGQPRLAIPRTAVVELNGQDVVFVQLGGEHFSRRRVKLGQRDATHVEVLAGVVEGERVVSEGGFDVHVAALSGSLESHRH